MALTNANGTTTRRFSQPKGGVKDTSAATRFSMTRLELIGFKEGNVLLLSLMPRAARPMPKLKTRKAAAKRFKATGTGKFMRRRAFHNHLLDHKSPKQKRHLKTKAVVDRTDEERVTLMMPYA